MILVEESELEGRIDELLDLVEAGNKIHIARHGEIVAALLPCQEAE